MSVEQIEQGQTMGADGLADSLTVRAYRPHDEPAVLALYRNGRLHGHAQDNCTALLRGMADAGFAGRHHVWVAEADSQVIGAIAMATQHDHIAHLLWLCVAPGWDVGQLVGMRLVETATAHARERAYLKLVVHTSLAAADAAALFHPLAFEFSRERGIGDMHVLEFYLNLYLHLRPRKPRH